MNSKYKNLWIILFTVLISAIFFVVQFRQGYHTNYYADSFSRSMSLERVMDVDLSDDSLIKITGEDPYLVYSLSEPVDYLSCKLIFSDEILDAPLQLHIYYSDGISEFSEDKTIDVTVDMSSDHVSFNLPKDLAVVKYIRIDFDNALSSVPSVRFVGLQDASLLSRLVGFLLRLVYNYLFIIPIFILVFALVYYYQNRGKKDVQRKYAAIVIIGMSIFLLAAVAINYKEKDLSPVFSEEKYIVDTELGDVGLTNDVEVSAQGYKIVGGDAFVTYKVDIPYGRGIRVIFENSFETPGIIQLFYAEAGHGLSEEKAVRVNVDTEQKYVDVPVSLSNVSVIRIDVEMAENTEFEIIGLQLDVGIIGYIGMLLKKYIWIYLGIFSIVIGTVLINRKGVKRKYAAIVTMGVLFILLAAVTINYKEKDLSPVFSEEKYIVDTELGAVGLTNDVEVSAQGYKIVGEDAFVTYKVDIPYGRGIRVIFENSFENPGSLQLFYTATGYRISEEKAVRVSVDIGQKYIDVPVSLSDVSVIRIDVEMPENSEFKIIGLQLDVGIIGYMGMLLKKYIWIYLGIFVLGIVIGTVLINKKMGYFNDKSCLFAVIVMLISVVLVALMSSLSGLNMHPDEMVTKLAIDYYLNHWLPPDVRSADISNTFSAYGNTRLHELTVYYFLAGKIGLIFKELCHYTHYYRVFNFLLYIIMIGIVIHSIKKESWLLIVVALTPQLWYIFSYATSDAWDFFCSFLLIYQAVSKDSVLNKALEDKCSCRQKIMTHALFGILSAFVMLGKQNYYVTLLLLFIIFMFKLINSQKDERSNLFKKYLLILVFFGGVLILRYSINLYYYGFDESEIYSQVKEERAEYEFKASTPVEEQRKGLHLKEKGVTLQELFHVYRFGILSYKSFVGVFGNMRYFCSNVYYWIIGWLLVMLLIAVYWFALKKKSVINTLEIFIVTINMFLSVILSIYNSWYLDLQAQGRYLLPMIISFSYIVSKSEPSTIMEKRFIIGMVGTLQILACVAFFKYGILMIVV